MHKKLKLISVITLYLSSNFIFYFLTCEHNTLFLLYKIIYGGLFFIVMFYTYKYFQQNTK